jgi:putative restriction endonuclease
MERPLHYPHIFSSLRVDRSSGINAPHKPILLLTLLQAVKSGLINSSLVYITPELVALFKSNWSALVTTEHQCRMSYPFFHLKSSKFWKLHPNPGFENAILVSTKSPSLNQLMQMVTCAEMNTDLFELMKTPEGNAMLSEVLLQTYFPDSRNKGQAEVQIPDLFSLYEQQILAADSDVYAQQIKKLIDEKEEEEIFIRGGAFKREIPKVYNFTCCISGLRISTSRDISMIDACHIRPFSQSYDDTISNGIALSPTLHRAFDRGLITIDADYRVLVSSHFSESEVPHSLRQLHGIDMLRPEFVRFMPSQENLAWHREKVFIAR